MEAHVPIKRLLAVASTDDMVFIPEEFNHLKECAECFGMWTDFIQQLIRNKQSVWQTLTNLQFPKADP